MSEVIKTAREVLTIEAEGILRLKKRLNSSFEKAVEMILASPGKVITTGIGKSGIVARKITATLSSTGTTSLFLHPVEALHGDLGMVQPGDVVLALSHSGQTGELSLLVPQLKRHGAKVVAMTGGLDSPLARAADLVVDCGVEREACPLGLAPTASTTAALAMGDALAVVLMEKHRTQPEDFQRHHPGGNLGQHLSLKASQVMTKSAAVPTIRPSAKLARAVQAIDDGDLGTVLITSRGILKGILTDGDLRRVMLSDMDIKNTPVSQIMSQEPLAVSPDIQASEALQLMSDKQITALPVVDGRGKILGLLHLHDLLGRGTISFNGLIPE